MDARDYIRDALNVAHLRACVDANEDAVGQLTALINSLDDGDPADVTTGTTVTTGSSAPVDTILQETGIVPSGHNTPQQDIIVEIARLRGELNTQQDANRELELNCDNLGRQASEYADALEVANGEIESLRTQLADLTPAPTAEAVDPNAYTRDELDALARDEDVQGAADMATKQDVADAINTKRGVTP